VSRCARRYLACTPRRPHQKGSCSREGCTWLGQTRLRLEWRSQAGRERTRCWLGKLHMNQQGRLCTAQHPKWNTILVHTGCTRLSQSWQNSCQGDTLCTWLGTGPQLLATPLPVGRAYNASRCRYMIQQGRYQILEFPLGRNVMGCVIPIQTWTFPVDTHHTTCCAG
jgi:hypothetical protein